LSIGRRLIDLARAELNSLLDRASTSSTHGDEPRDPDEDLYRRYGLSELTDAQLEAELDRRRQAREAAARAARARAEESARAARARAEESARRTAQAASRSTPADEIRRAYIALEVTQGSDFATVRKSYRALMRKYHPDRHGQSPEKQKAANEVAQRLTAAYRTLSRHLGK
jgi:DnaJ-domain-containing protein 1